MYAAFLIWSGLFCFLSAIFLLNSNNGNKRQPPGPPGWPVVGNIFDLGTIAHRSLYELKSKYGPVLWLRLGWRNTVVIQSAKAAAELFKNHDSSFCDRTVPHVLTSHNYDEGSLAIGRFGSYWRMVRRICAAELLATKRIRETVLIRQKCIDIMIRNIGDEITAANAKGELAKVNLAHHLFLLTFNLVGNLMVSKDLLDSKCKEGYDFYKAMDKITLLVGTPNIADFMPWLKWLDPQGLKREISKNMERAKEIMEGFIKERIEEYKLREEKRKRDFLDVLLEYEGDGKEWIGNISYQKIIIIIMEMFMAGSETTGSTIEWAMAELFNNPEAMRKVKKELDTFLGEKKKVEESDIENLPYLQAVVKEVLRLHPVVPLLIPRNTLQDTNFMGYHIPKDTQVFVNAWAIGRDSEFWVDPMNFNPERFLDSSIDYKGHNFELIPFGSGRRICIGMALAQKVIPLSIASLLHSFEWDIANKSTTDALSLKERMGITMKKLVPLTLFCKKRQSM